MAKIAEKRMFAKTVVDSDAFLEMPLSSQALYFHLNMRADDDGFVNNPRKIQRMIGCADDDFKILLAKRFVLAFGESGVVVIKHWRLHNCIRRDTYKETLYVEEKSTLYLKPDGAYTDHVPEALPEYRNDSVTTPLQALENPVTQIRLDKDSKDNIGGKSSKFIPPTLEEVQAYCQERKNKVDPVTWWNFYNAKNWYVGKNKMSKWKSAVITWENKDGKLMEQPITKAIPKKYREVDVNGEIFMEEINE